MIAYHVDELRQFQAEFDCQSVGIVTNWPDETVVIGQQVFVEPFGILVGRHQADGEHQQQQQTRHPRPSTVNDGYPSPA